MALGLQHGKVNKELNKFEFESGEGEKAFQDGGRELLEKPVQFEGETFTIFELGARKITAGDFLSANDLLTRLAHRRGISGAFGERARKK